MTRLRIPITAFCLLLIAADICYSRPHYGKYVGPFESISNGVKGDIFLTNDQTIFIKRFSYDGNSDDAVFWAGSSDYPDASGFPIPDDTPEFFHLPVQINQDIVLRLPDGKSIKDIRWLSIWNRKSSKSLGTLVLPNSIEPPHPMAIGPLINTQQGVSTGDILILDTQTFFIRDFNYDGSEKELYWWLSKGTKPSEDGIRLLDNGSEAPLQKSENATTIVTLPEGYFVPDYDTLSIWSVREGVNYGFVDVPKDLNIPPSMHSIGKQDHEMGEFNCEMLNDNLGLEIRWLIEGDDAIVQLVGKIGPSEYMALGLSKDDSETKFDSADAVVAGVDANGNGYAIDYFFESNEKCENGRGMCPDAIHGFPDNLELLKTERRVNSTFVSFKRRLVAVDKVYDQNIYTDGPQAILWAVGQMLPNGFTETPTLQSKGNLLLDFGREPNWNCPPEKSSPPPVQHNEKNYRIHCPIDRIFKAQLGSSPRSNVKKVWFINGLPTPEITIQRGNTYTFVVEGGLNPPLHHPFYITSSKEGGMYRNMLEANDARETTYAGIQEDRVTGTIFPVAEGRLCEWSYSTKNPEFSVETSNLDINPTLVLKCEPGQSGRLIWTPSADTPDVVYYQSFMERNLGGKIHVVDFCEETNPNRYLESNRKGGQPNPYPKRGELERESEEGDSFLSSNSKKGVYSNEERNRDRNEEKLSNENIQKELIHGTLPPKVDKYTLSSNAISSFQISPNNYSEGINSGEKQLLSESTTAATPLTPSQSEEVFPHDESERSDIYLAHHTGFKEVVNQNKASLNSHRNSEDLPIKHPAHSSESISSLRKLPPQEFKPHFEGGFVPLVTNPMKEREFAQTKDIVYPPQYLNRPHRPFLYNESVPFHGTFKPGIPDFSGFNISNYSQEDASVIIAHNQDNLPILSASKPQPIHKPFPPMGHLPLHLLQRHNARRPQDFNSRFRQQNPPFSGTRQNVYSPLPINNKPNFAIPNIREEDLASVPSQRVYVSLQSTGDIKSNPQNVPRMRYPLAHNRKPQNPQSNKMIYPHPIQRRPDFYEEKEINNPPSNVPQRNFNVHRIPPNVNKHNSQQLHIPNLHSGGLQGNINTRPQAPNSKLPLNSNLPANREHIIMSPGSLRHPFPINPQQQREKVSQVPTAQRIIPLRNDPLPNDKSKISGALLNHPQNADKRLPFPVHMLNSRGKLPISESNDPEESYESESFPPRENRPLPLLENAELVEVPNKDLPQKFTKERPGINPNLMMQNLPVNGTFNAFSTNSNIRNTHGGSINTQIFPNQRNHPLPPNSSNTSENENVPSSDMSNMPNLPEVYSYFHNSDSERPQFPNVLIKTSLPKLENTKSDSRPANFDHQDFEKAIFEAMASGEFSSNPPNKDLPPFSDHHPERDQSDRSDSVEITADFGNFDVPFGARLKFPLNGTKVPLGPFKEIPRTPSGVIRRPHTSSVNNKERNSNIHKNKLVELPTTTITSSTRTTTTTTERSISSSSTTTTTTTEATLLALDDLSNIHVSNKQNISFDTEGNPKNLYYTPPFSSLPAFPQFINSSEELNQDITSSDEVKHIPIIADTLEEFIHTKYIGRKNLLPQNSNYSHPVVLMPPRVSENINLPQISENPPTHDNRTDYSILNHVLTLIGGPPEQKKDQSSS